MTQRPHELTEDRKRPIATGDSSDPPRPQLANRVVSLEVICHTVEEGAHRRVGYTMQ